LFRLNGLTQRLEFLSEKDGLPHQSITDLAIDREGSLWLGTYRAGLCRLRDASFENFTMRNGLSALVINTVCELDNFRIMVGTGSGDLHIINDNNVIDFPIKTELTNSRIKHVNQTSWGDILVSTYSGLLTIKPSGEEILLDDKSGLPDNQTRVTLEDNDGNIWIGTRSGGAVKYNPITKEIEILNQDNGLSSDFIMAIEQDKAKKIYFGLNSAGLDILFPNGEVENYGIDELGTNLVFNIHLDKEGNAWIATNAGMTLLKPDGETYRFTTENGLTSEVVFDILEDDLENLWFTSSEGVFTAPKQSFLLIAEGKESYLSVRNYGKEDGMVEKETTGATQSLVGSGGKLFFPTLGGLSVFDPNYKIEALPQAPVYINQVLADGQTIDLESKEIKLSSDLKRVSFNYTVLNLTTPHKIKFQYKLKDYEDWVNAHGERQAVYTNISSGWHEFQVRASDSNGNFDKGQSDTIRFYRSPKFYETYFFYISVFLITAGFAFLFYRIRIKTIQKRNKELEALIDKRTYQIQKQKDKLELAYNDIRTVSSIGQEVTSVLDVDVLINTVYENVKTLMQTDIFGIAIYSKSDKQLEFRNLIRNGEILPSYIEQLKDGLYLSVKCFNSNEPIFINNTKEEYPEFDIYLNTLNRNEEEDSKSAIFVPLVIDKKPVGVLTVQSLNLDSYKNQHLTILEALASYISVALENSRIYAEITNKNHQITNSIRYAETIQQAVLPSIEKMNEALHEYFIIYKPKDIVSGDFYWFTHLGDKIFIAAVDCTGHGVPGAFMSMIGSSLLNEIVNLERITNPSEILKRLDIDIQIALKQEKTGNSDGMDVALCVLEPAEDFCAKITFSGAKRPLYYVQDGILEEVKGVNKAIGGKHKRPDRMFKSEEIILKPGSIFYLSTDGLVDQNSSTDSVGKRYGTTRLKELIEKSNSSDMESQKAIFEKSIEGYQGDKPQRDDITIIGVRV
ncbi:MAG: serine phosphatase RsbU (regulator of sigma subunit), partial [Arenicella sp.]